MLSKEHHKSQPQSSLGCILVVEDEFVIRDTMALTLKEEGYEVLVAEDGQSALNLAKRVQNLDLIIMDVMLPAINGLDLCRVLRHEGNRVPVLMVSARGNESDRIVGLEVGADDYLCKPFGMRELVARCRALLRRSRQPSPNAEEGQTFQFGEITMYPQECRVMVRGTEVNLSPKEFRILELFMSRPRRVWSREQLLEKIWGADFIGDSKTVDVHIRWLREKLEDDPSEPKHLVTVRGFGYRLG
ncbi:MAG: response regulator transcription factor [Pseudanabaenaceae cyanobacterium]|jgi:two-component system phosphate regulon response regulator PhoB